MKTTLFGSRAHVYTDNDLNVLKEVFDELGLQIDTNPHIPFKTSAEHIKVTDKQGRSIIFQYWFRPYRTTMAQSVDNYPRPNIPYGVKLESKKESWIRRTIETYEKHNIYFIVVVPKTMSNQNSETCMFWFGRHKDIPIDCWKLNPDNYKASRLLFNRISSTFAYTFVDKHILKKEILKILSHGN